MTNTDLDPNVEALWARCRTDKERARALASALDNQGVANMARHWGANCGGGVQLEGTYDHTFWNIIFPEMVKRLEQEQ